MATHPNNAGLTDAEIMRRDLEKALQECQDQLAKVEAALRETGQENAAPEQA